MTIVYLASNFLTGISSDTKPTTVPTNSVFAQTNTLTLYLFDGAAWNLIGGSSSDAKTTALLTTATTVIETTELNPSSASLITTITVIETATVNPSAVSSISATPAFATP